MSSLLSAVLLQGSRSSLHPFGIPLYPMPTILFSAFTMQAPTYRETCREGVVTWRGPGQAVHETRSWQSSKASKASSLAFGGSSHKPKKAEPPNPRGGPRGHEWWWPVKKVSTWGSSTKDRFTLHLSCQGPTSGCDLFISRLSRSLCVQTF